MDFNLRNAWDAKLNTAREDDLRRHRDLAELQFLPFPFLPAFDLEYLNDQMFAWDTYFVDLALLAHERYDIVRDHIRNYLFMVDRHGYMPNANHRHGLTRSQTPVYPDAIWRYYKYTGDGDILLQAYPLLKREFQCYWCGIDHQTPTGLATNRDLGDLHLSPQMASEAETGLDWTPIYGGDVRRCTPLITNCALVRYARVLELIATELGRTSDASEFGHEAQTRAELVRSLCWDADRCLFVEYDYVSGVHLPFVSSCTLWPLWAGIATAEQAKGVVNNLGFLEQPYGLAATDRAYDDPHPLLTTIDVHADVPAYAVGGLQQLQWMYPSGWGCMQMIAVEGLDAYGYGDDAIRIAAAFLKAIVGQYQITGRLWEKYNVVDGGIVLPNSRYGNMPLLSWTAGAAIVLGQRVFYARHS